MALRRCTRCTELKPEAAFAMRRRHAATRFSYCRTCASVYRRSHYERHRETYIARAAEQKRATRLANRALICMYLQTHPCVDCGETDPVVLDFDHGGSTRKEMTISRMANNRSWESVLREVRKCQVRCANCHRRRTARQFSWTRLMYRSPGEDPGDEVDVPA